MLSEVLLVNVTTISEVPQICASVGLETDTSKDGGGMLPAFAHSADMLQTHSMRRKMIVFFIGQTFLTMRSMALQATSACVQEKNLALSNTRQAARQCGWSEYAVQNQG